jgi:F-type H+-transporting ATPase subunit delta
LVKTFFNDNEIIKKTISPQVCEQTSNFLLILADRNRINYLEAITERYLELVYELANIKIVEVASASEISEEQQQMLIDKLQTMTNAKEIKLLISLDTSLMGGFLIKTNSQVIDLTVKGQLKELAKHLDSVLDI